MGEVVPVVEFEVSFEDIKVSWSWLLLFCWRDLDLMGGIKTVNDNLLFLRLLLPFSSFWIPVAVEVNCEVGLGFFKPNKIAKAAKTSAWIKNITKATKPVAANVRVEPDSKPWKLKIDWINITTDVTE